MALDAAFLRNPYPRYAQWREAGPVLWSDAFFQGGWLLTRHDAVEAVLRDARLSAQRTAGWVKRIEGGSRRTQMELAAFQHLMASALLFMDEPLHPPLRAALMAGFHPAHLQAHVPAITALVQAHLAAATGPGRDGGLDFMAAIARPLPSHVTCLLMGIPATDSPTFMAWSDDLAAFISAPQPSVEQAHAASRCLLAMRDYLRDLLAWRRSQRKPEGAMPDLIDRLLMAEAQGLLRTDTDLLAQFAMLLLAGHETTRNLLGNGVHALLMHPGQWQRLLDQPTLVPHAVRELLRYDSPVQYTARRATADMELYGQRIGRGELVVALIGSANRDPARHPCPDTLDVARRGSSHLAFGRGAHFCIGAGLALMQAEILLTHLLQAWPDLHLHAQPRWNGNAALRGLAELPVAVG